MGAVAFLALRGRAAAAPPPGGGPGNGLVPEIGKITIGTLGTHQVSKDPGGFFLMTGSFTYRGPADSIDVTALISLGGTFVASPRGRVAVSESVDFVSRPYSISGNMPTTTSTVDRILDGQARAVLVSNPNIFVLSPKHLSAYRIPATPPPIPPSEIGTISATFGLQGRRRRGFMRAR